MVTNTAIADINLFNQKVKGQGGIFGNLVGEFKLIHTIDVNCFTIHSRHT